MLRRIEGILTVVANATEGSRNSKVYWAAKRFEEMIMSGLIDRGSSRTPPIQYCQLSGLDGNEISDRDERITIMNDKVDYKVKLELNNQPKLDTVTMKDIHNMHFSPREYVVPALIPARGLTLLVAKPKMRKSFLLLNLSIAATMNLEFLGVTPKQGPVLYLSLEDDHQRIQERSRLMYPDYVSNWKWPEQLLFAYDCPRLDEGGLEAILDCHDEMKKRWGKPCFIAIDVFQKNSTANPKRSRSIRVRLRRYEQHQETYHGTWYSHYAGPPCP